MFADERVNPFPGLWRRCQVLCTQRTLRFGSFKWTAYNFKSFNYVYMFRPFKGTVVRII